MTIKPHPCYKAVSFWAATLLCLTAQLASAVSTLPFYEPFIYGQGVQLGGTTSATVWDQGNSASSSSSIVRTNATLTYLAMPVGSTNGLQSGSGTGKNRGADFTPQASGSIYASFMFSVQTNPLSGRIFAALTDTVGTGPNARAAVFLDTQGRLHIGKLGSSYTTMEAASTYSLISSNPYLVVLRYKYNPATGDDQVALWLNPTGLGNNASEPPPTLTTTNGADAGSIQAFYHMAPSSGFNGVANLYMDEIRVSTSWADVTPTNGFDSTVYSMTGGGTNCPGSSFAVGLSGSSANVDYYLFTNGVSAGITPGTGSPLNFGTFSTALTFNVLASNTVSSVVAWMNGTAVISIPDAPSFTTQPVDYTVHTGGLTIYKAVTTGAITTYQWRKNGINLSNGGNIFGATSDTLIISPAGGGDAAIAANGYDLVIVDTCNTTNISTRVALTVNAATSLIWAGSTSSNVAPWDIGLTASWSNGVATSTFFNGDAVLFDDSAVLGLPQRVVFSNANLNPASIIVNAAGDYTFVGGTLVGPTTTLLKTGSGTLEFTNNAAGNTFSGGTTLSNGTVLLRNYPVLGSGPVNMAGGNLTIVPSGSATTGLSNTLNVVANSTLQYNAANGTFAGVIFGPITGTPGATLTVSHAGAGPDRLRVYAEFTNSVNLDLSGSGIALAPYVSAGRQVYNGVISGSGAIVNRAGNGSIITLNNTNTYTGGTTITTGSIGLGVDSISSGGSVIAGPLGTGALFPANESGAGGDAAILASGGARTVENPVTFAATTNEFTLIIEGTNSLNLAGPMSLGGATRAIRVDNTNAPTTISGPIDDGGGAFGLLKTGAGTLYLNGTNTYTGLTTISNGALGGTGIIAGPVKVESGELLTPGASIGTLTINSDLDIGGNVLIEINKSNPLTNDYVVVSGVLTNSGTGTVTVANQGAAFVAGNSFKLFSQPVLNGAALTITPAPGAGLSWTNTLALDGSIAVLVGGGPIVATNRTNITMTTSGGNLNLSWPSDHLGWSLQAQTNTRAVGLNTNWFTLPGYETTNTATIAISPANPTVFYRLFYLIP